MLVQVRSISPKTLVPSKPLAGTVCPVVVMRLDTVLLRLGKHRTVGSGQPRVLRVRAVAVDVGLVEIAEISIRLVGPGIARLPARACGQEGELVLSGLRNGIDARPILGEKLYRGRGGGAEIIIGAGEGDVELGLIAAGAEIDVDTPQRRRRVIAPTGIIDGVGGDIAGQVSDFAARLHGRANAPIRAAVHFAFDAVVSEAILHLRSTARRRSR